MTTFETSEQIHNELMARQPYVCIVGNKMFANVDAQGIGALIGSALVLHDIDDFDVQAGFSRMVRQLKNMAQTSADGS